MYEVPPHFLGYFAYMWFYTWWRRSPSTIKMGKNTKKKKKKLHLKISLSPFSAFGKPIPIPSPQDKWIEKSYIKDRIWTVSIINVDPGKTHKRHRWMIWSKLWTGEDQKKKTPLLSVKAKNSKGSFYTLLFLASNEEKKINISNFVRRFQT